MRWLWFVGSIKLYVSFAKDTYKRDDILQKRPIILSILLTVATPISHHCNHPYQIFHHYICQKKNLDHLYREEVHIGDLKIVIFYIEHLHIFNVYHFMF